MAGAELAAMASGEELAVGRGGREAAGCTHHAAWAAVDSDSVVGAEVAAEAQAAAAEGGEKRQRLAQ